MRIRTRARPVVTMAAGGLLVLCGGSCQRQLFANEVARTPFDAYDKRRSQDAVPYVFDAFGQRRPNLRQRLLPKD